MIRPPKRFKGSLEIWLADLAAERAAGKIDAVIRTRAQKVIDIWNARAEPLYWPTFKTTLRAGANCSLYAGKTLISIVRSSGSNGR